MATHDYVIANASGAAVRSDLNNALAAIVSNNSNATAPATTYAYQWWADTTTGLLKLRNAANSAWITIQQLDGTKLLENGTAAAPAIAFESDTNTGMFRVSADTLGLATNGTEALQINSVSSTRFNSSVGGAYKLFQYTDNAVLYSFRTGTGTENHIRFYNANGQVGRIYSNGSATAYATSSDYRLKENISPVSDGITRLKQLKPSRFNFIADPDTTVDGFLAHEVQDIVPEAIGGTKDAVDNEGNPEYQTIDQSKLVPLLTAALQEAITKIETLETRISALEAN